MPAGTSETKPPPPSEHPGDIQRGILLVATCAIKWSSGGLIARFLRVDDNWTMVFWHSLFAAAFLLTFMLARDGPKGPLALLRGMGRAGIGVALCFAVASPMFIVALAYTTVANMLLMQAGVPLIAARLAWILHGDKVSASTWAAIAAVITGIAIMASGSFGGQVSPLGDGLALVVSIALATPST